MRQARSGEKGMIPLRGNCRLLALICKHHCESLIMTLIAKPSLSANEILATLPSPGTNRPDSTALYTRAGPPGEEHRGRGALRYHQGMTTEAATGEAQS